MALWTSGPPNWRAHIELLAFGNEERLWVSRPSGDNLDVLAGFTPQGDAVFTRVIEGQKLDGDKLPKFPVGILQAIAEAKGPGDTTRETDLLRSMLHYERSRVDVLCERISELAKELAKRT